MLILQSSQMGNGWRLLRVQARKELFRLHLFLKRAHPSSPDSSFHLLLPRCAIMAKPSRGRTSFSLSSLLSSLLSAVSRSSLCCVSLSGEPLWTLETHTRGDWLAAWYRYCTAACLAGVVVWYASQLLRSIGKTLALRSMRSLRSLRWRCSFWKCRSVRLLSQRVLPTIL